MSQSLYSIVNDARVCLSVCLAALYPYFLLSVNVYYHHYLYLYVFVPKVAFIYDYCTHGQVTFACQ
jgi:hypothetical protein